MYYGAMSISRPLSISLRPLTDQNAAELAAVLTALSDPIRLRLFDLVRRSGSSGVCACDLIGPLDRSQPTISHHLKVLREAGIIQARRDGTWLWYSVVEHSLNKVAKFIQI